MGVEYEHWVLPKRRDYRPSTETVARLVEALRTEHWVAAEGEARVFGPNPNAAAGRRSRPITQPIPAPLSASWIDARLDAAHPDPLAREIGLYFRVELSDIDFADWQEAGIQYPFTFGEDDLSNSHKIGIYLADDFVAHDWTNAFGRIDSTCACGLKLAYDPDEKLEYVAALVTDWRIKRTCPSCGAVFDPSLRTAEGTDGWDDNRRFEVPGGITFRFAVGIDCEKGWPRGQGRLALKPAFRELVERLCGEPFEDLGGLY
jgi:hypothetical protein